MPEQEQRASRGRGGRLLPLAIGMALVLVVLVVALSFTGLGVVGALVVGVLVVQGVLGLGLVLLRRELLQTRRHLEDASQRRTRRLHRRLDRVTRRHAAQRQRRDRRARARRADVQRRHVRMHLDTQRQVQALLRLDRMVPVERSVPPMGGWAASPDLLEMCVQELLDLRPETVVECGSGLSTLYLALTIQQHDLPTRVVALEHQEDFAASTRALLEQHGVAHRVEVRLAPLVPDVLPDHATAWYDPAALGDLRGVGMLLVDGPPGEGGHHARFPAMPLLRDRLAPDCLVVMDDLNRLSDREVAEKWADLFPDFRLEVNRSLVKHVGLLRRTTR